MLTASVIIPTFNYAQFIGNAIDSVLNQEGLGELTQIIVVDDGSTDNTEALLQPLAALGKLTYLRTPNKGKAAATRLGLQHATGDIIFTLDADDWFLPLKIKTTLDIFEKYPEVNHVASPALYKWQDGQREDIVEQVPEKFLGKPTNGLKMQRYFMDHRMLYGGGSTFAARAVTLRQIDMEDDIDMYTDEWLVMQTLLRGNSYFHDKPLSVWNIHGVNFSAGHHVNPAQKAERLLHSSAFILNKLQQDKAAPDWLQNAYALKHTMRRIENGRKQGSSRIWNHWQWVIPHIISFRYALPQLWKYGAIKALLH